MPISSRKYLNVIVLLSIALTFLIYIHTGRAKDISSAEPLIKLSGFPLEIGEWKGRDIPLSERTYAILETEDVFVREYTNPEGESIGLAVVRSGSERGAFHPPEICYLGGGVELLDKTVEMIDVNNFLSIKVNKLVMKDKAGLQVAWYWFSVGNDFTHNYYLQQCRFVLNELLKRGPNGGALIRVSTRVIGEDLSQADARAKDFIKAILTLDNS